MANVEQLFLDYIAEHQAGGTADPLAYLERVDGLDRAELVALIDAYLSRSLGRDWDPEAFKGSASERVAEGIALSIQGESGWWPMVLPRLRNQARLTRRQVVERLTAALGAKGREQKVHGYYHDMEHGSLASAGVSQRVLTALAEIYGASAERLRELGEPVARGPRPAAGEPAPAMARTTQPDARYEKSTADSLDDAYRATPVAPAERDEIDEMFTGGS